MKKQQLLLFVIFLTSTLTLSAQSPQGFNYQTVVRNATGEILANQTIGTQFILHQSTPTGTAVYTETWSTSTNDYGLLSFAIGNGTSADDFSLIDWSAGPYYLETLLDVSGGTTYVSMGTTQILSVPFAIHSEIAENVMNETQGLSDVLINSSDANGQIKNLTDPTDPQDASTKAYVDLLENRIADLEFIVNPPEVGDYFRGGVVFYILQSGDPGYDPEVTHGLIAAIEYQSIATTWHNGTDVVTGATSELIGGGANNTDLIIAVQGAGSYAATLAADYSHDGYDDWFLPSKDELVKMYSAISVINSTSVANGGEEFQDPGILWSSTEVGIDQAWYHIHGTGYPNSSPALGYKYFNAIDVRAIRYF